LIGQTKSGYKFDSACFKKLDKPQTRVSYQIVVSNIMKVVILAISKKLNGYCVAGKEVRPDGTFGGWVRPVTRHRENNVIWNNDMTYVDGSLAQLLDIAEIPLEAGPDAGPVYQTENRWCPNHPRWVRAGNIERADTARIAAMEDKPANLWLPPTPNLQSDRLPLAQANENFNSSLLFVRAENLRLSKETNYGGRGIALRVAFGYKGGRYRLKWTVQSRLKEAAISMFDEAAQPITSDQPTWVCVSLGEPFHDHVYRLAAAVIGPDFPV